MVCCNVILYVTLFFTIERFQNKLYISKQHKFVSDKSGNIASKFKINSPDQQMLKQKVLPPSPVFPIIIMKTEQFHSLTGHLAFKTNNVTFHLHNIIQQNKAKLKK